MRADLKDVIVNTGRQKYGEKLSSSLVGMSDEELEALPERQAMRKNHTEQGFSFGDRTQPLYGFLEKHCGRSWDDVFSEICEHADPRTVRGLHLRQHVRDYVRGSGDREALISWAYNSFAFFVNNDGILCKNENYLRRHFSREVQHDPDRCMIGDKIYERVNNCWFRCIYERVQKAHKTWNHNLLCYEVEYYYYEDIYVRKKQLSKRELRRLGLSNNPNFKWWEKT